MTALARHLSWLFAAALAAVPAFAQEAAPDSRAPVGREELLRLSRQQAIEEALARNFGLMATREQVEEARAQVVLATAFADPSFAADITGETNPMSPHSATGSDQGVAVTFPFPGK